MTVKPVSRFELVDGLQLHYWDWGNPRAQTLLLLHGLTGESRSWDPFAFAMAEEYHVIALDLRGHGDSDWSAEYGVGVWSSDTATFVNQLGLERAVVCGLSFGGRVAFRYAALRPAAVDRLIVVDIGPPASPSQQIPPMPALLDDWESRDEAVRYFVARARAAPPGALYMPEEAVPLYLEHNLKQTDTGRWILKYDKRVLLQSRSSAPGVSLGPDEWGIWQSVACPTLLIRGSRSVVLSPQTAERMMAENSNCVQLVIDSDHPVNLQKPGEFEAAVRDWLVR